MTRPCCYALQVLLEKFSENDTLKSFQNKISNIPFPVSEQSDINNLIDIYNKALLVISPAVNEAGVDISDEILEQYHDLYRELEDLISLNESDRRHKITVVIPVADRPKHLKACLNSLYELCEKFGYGGIVDVGTSVKKYRKVTVLVADDSKDELSIARHKEIVEKYNQLGIETEYFSLADQLKQLESIPDNIRSKLSGVLGDNATSSFYHKGASIMRNIVYLKLQENINEDEFQLYYFIDSDQEFKVKIPAIENDRNLYLVNYFFELDKIFTHKDVSVLTGKVVGDPPVSPAVMAGNFLDDVIAFLKQLSNTESGLSCGFHGAEKKQVNDASYHDMAELFGFKHEEDAYEYNCSLQGEHDNEKCMSNFSKQLNRFFYGEHPTRKMYYEYEDALSSVKPARTVYTGNYVFNSTALNYFIPFATLKLRMAGPVLGRIIKAELGDKFVSSNLPMLHKRTYEDTGVSEFRSGISQGSRRIDLSGEFERQYFGDVMLFAIEKLTDEGFPDKEFSENQINTVLNSVEVTVNAKYLAKHKEIAEKLNKLKTLFNDNAGWWNQGDRFHQTHENIQSFIENIEYNFNDESKGAELINSESLKAERLQAMCAAVLKFKSDRQAWSDTLAFRNQ